jgi:hypothetical protein
MPRAQPDAAASEDRAVVRILGLLLVDALQTIALGRRVPGGRQTREWVCASDGGRAYSFEDACAVFGLPPKALRRRLGLREHGGRRASVRGFTRGPSQ